MKYRKVLDEVLKEITPSVAESKRALSLANDFLRKINSSLKKFGFSARAVLGGSYAKNTWLAGDYDVDVFVKFALKHKYQNLSEMLEKALKPFKFQRVHGSRDYFWVQNSVRFEVVPVLNIRNPSDAENVTDFSPLHVDWVNDKGKSLKDDIRLLKKFCKSAKCYGAESYVRGFSGHVVDILAVHYKGFIPVLRAASKWKPKVVIDYNKAHKGRALFKLNKSKIEGPLVVVDPVQPGRNAAAALTGENFDRFVKSANAFLRRPSKQFFVEKQVDFDKLAKRGKLVRVFVESLKAKEDVAGVKFVRAFEKLKDGLSGFVIKDSGWLWDRKERGIWWFLLKNKTLPPVKELKGPPLDMASAVKEFKRAHKSTFVRSGRVWARVKRKNRTPEQVIRSLAKEEFIKSRVRRVKL